MSMNPRLVCELAELVLHSLNGTLDEAGMQALEDLLEKNPMAVSYYQELLWVYVGLNSMEGISSLQEVKSRTLDRDFWQAMLQEEQTAPTVRIRREEPQQPLIAAVERPKMGYKMRKGPLVSLLMTAAAILLLVLFIRFAPPQGVQAGVMGDSLGAKWADCDSAMTPGAPLTIGSENLLLREGCAELVFNTQARLMVEGPAEFQIASANKVRLHYGKVYAIVPPEAVGFTIQTHTATIVDLGTEFGVQADLNGDTLLQVIKGRTTLTAAGNNTSAPLDVTDDTAKKVSAATLDISDVPLNEHLFVRHIRSTEGLVWRGEKVLCAADLIAGGNGYGKNLSLIGLSPGTGKYTSTISQSVRSSKIDYNPVPDSRFIDGVFVPGSSPEGKTVISSSGDTFECPETQGKFTHAITVYTGDIEKRHRSIPPAIFGNHTYHDNAIVMIHSNAGITLDLQAVRQSLPGLDVTRFMAFGGLSEALRSRTGPADVDFWVLVDGQVRYEKKDLTVKDGTIYLDIELAPQDRFLTLIVTDGFKPGEPPRGYSAGNNDFFYLVDPKLHLAESSR